MNSTFDRDLRRALKRREPPPSFSDRVIARLPAKHGRSHFWFAAVAAGLALVFTFGGVEQNRREQRMTAERTGQQMAFALFLVSEKLDHAMNHANVRLQRAAPDVTIGGEDRGRL